jgi:hypothetical protein
MAGNDGGARYHGKMSSRAGWFKRVHMKASATHIDRAALRIRAQLITARNAMANQMRGLLTLFGLRMGSARTPGRRADRLASLYRQRPDLEPCLCRSLHQWRRLRRATRIEPLARRTRRS